MPPPTPLPNIWTLVSGFMASHLIVYIAESGSFGFNIVLFWIMATVLSVFISVLSEHWTSLENQFRTFWTSPWINEACRPPSADDTSTSREAPKDKETEPAAQKRLPRLSMDIVRRIAHVLARPKETTRPVGLDMSSCGPLARPKPSFDGLRGLSGVNREIRAIVLVAWFETMYIRVNEDWGKAAEMKICNDVLEIRVLATALDMKALPSNTILTRFTKLHTAFIDAHQDFVPRNLVKRNQRFWKLLETYPEGDNLPLLSFLILPDTLRRLWITNMHYGALPITHISEMCPNLEDLFITRCTPFTQTQPRAGQPRPSHGEGLVCHQDYSIMMEGRNSAWIALMENPLPRLKTLGLGTFNMPKTPFGPNPVNPEQAGWNPTCKHGKTWTDVCEPCIPESAPKEIMSAIYISKTLAVQMPHLQTISWPLFCSRKNDLIVWTPRSVRVPWNVMENMLPLKEDDETRLPPLVSV